MLTKAKVACMNSGQLELLFLGGNVHASFCFDQTFCYKHEFLSIFFMHMHKHIGMEV